MLDTCQLCRGAIEQRDIDVDFRWGGTLKMILGVPAGVCRQCGERYFDSGAHKAIEKLAASRRKPATQVAVDVLELRAA